MEATASTRSPSTWNRSSQNSALAVSQLTTSARPKLKMAVFQSGWKPCRGSSCS